MMTYTVSIIPQAVLNVVYNDAAGLLEPAVAQSDGRHNVNTVMDRVSLGDYQLWMAFSEENKPIGALITLIEPYPLKTMLNLLFCGGKELEEWHEDMLVVLEKFAKDNGCDGMELVGRPGWKRFLEKHGWGSSHLVVERTFDIEEVKKEAA